MLNISRNKYVWIGCNTVKPSRYNEIWINQNEQRFFPCFGVPGYRNKRNIHNNKI